MKYAHSNQSQNLIINKLPAPLKQNLEKCLESVEMPLTQILCRPKEKIKYVYFPDTSVISIVTFLENGDCVESGIIGKEGVFGAAFVFGGNVSPTEASVQHSGDGRRIKITDFRMFFDRDKEFRDAVLLYNYSYLAQISQNAACLAHHTIEKRLARWLLMFADRRDDDTLVLTQEFIAQMLGVHRPSVSLNASKLQKMNLIAYNRGTIKILDRGGLENLACECYRAINESLHGFADGASFN